MPKMKTHSGAKKRFKLTASGKVKAKKVKLCCPHKDSAKGRRHNKGANLVNDTQVYQVKLMLGMQ